MTTKTSKRQRVSASRNAKDRVRTKQRDYSAQSLAAKKTARRLRTNPHASLAARIENERSREMPSYTPGEPLLTVENVVTYLGVSEWSVLRYMRDNKLRYLRVGKLLKIPQSEVMRFLGLRSDAA